MGIPAGLRLTTAEIEEYREVGYLVKEDWLPAELIDQARDELPDLVADDGPHRFLEADSVNVRAIYGLHERAGVWEQIARFPRLVGAVSSLLGDDVYLFQWKINPKASDGGDHWDWHRDFEYWCVEDGVPTPAMVTAAVFFDDVTPDNGPMVLVPGSHLGAVEVSPAAPETGDEGWSALVSASLKYTIPADEITEKHPICGPKGTLLLFHPNLVHGSSANTSSTPRTLGFLTYNLASNAPAEPRRPGFFINHDSTPIAVVEA